jgi:N-methylhydantoinase B/oxoprolinase/acetone carboxylase alpha subunit
LLTDHPWPARNPSQNLADMRAQIAANEKGVAELRKMVGHFTLPVVQAYMNHVQDNAEESVRRVIDALADCAAEYPTDNGQTIKVKITVDKDSARGDRRFHRHLADGEEQFQRARAGGARRRALRVPADGRGATSR